MHPVEDQDDRPNVVVFRTYPDGSVIALFPEIPGREDDGGACYTLVGEHGAADYHRVIQETRPAAKAEYWHTKVVLERLGYRLKILQRVPARLHSARRRQWRKEMKP